MDREYNDRYWEKEPTSHNLSLFLIRNLRPVFAKKYAKIMSKFVNDINRPKILEVGCGTAATLHYLKSYISDLAGYGIDSSQVAVDIAESKGNNFNFLKGDAFDLPFKDNFNLAYSVGLIEHFSREEALDIMLQKKAAVVKNGYIGAVVPAKIGLLNLYERCLGKKWLFDTEIPFTGRELKEFMERMNLKDVRIYYVYFMTLLGIGRKV
ncbi:MAG: class I SAM-dependent methyltransferase [bacterium]